MHSPKDGIQHHKMSFPAFVDLGQDGQTCGELVQSQEDLLADQFECLDRITVQAQGHLCQAHSVELFKVFHVPIGIFLSPIAALDLCEGCSRRLLAQSRQFRALQELLMSTVPLRL